jgi:hypothetical protein
VKGRAILRSLFTLNYRLLAPEAPSTQL